MPKKITMRDIAREAGVSVATVSYIMNNRTDQKISEATRKKVLQLANLLDYTPNSAAKSLATGKGNIIGIIGCRRDDAPCRALEDAYFTDLLMRRLNRLGYDALTAPFSPGSDLPAFHRDVDAVITIDLPHRDFVELADNCYVPVINVHR